MNATSAVVFDFFGTLTPSRSKIIRDQEKTSTADLLGIPRGAWISAVDRSWPDRVTGLDPDLASHIGRLARQLGHEPTEEQIRSAVEQRHAGYLDTSALLRKGWEDSLDRIRLSGAKLGLVTDCGVELPEVWDRHPLSKHMDAVVFSAVERLRKPDRRLFERCAQRLRVRTEECLYVGDGSGDELAGAAAAGMHPVLFQPEDWEQHDALDRHREWSGRVVTSLDEVADLVSRLVAEPAIPAAH